MHDKVDTINISIRFIGVSDTHLAPRACLYSPTNWIAQLLPIEQPNVIIIII